MIYNFIVLITTFLVSILAFFNKKLQLFVRGRKQSFQKISAFNSKDKVVWFHAASLGEFEQGRPIIERLKEKHPEYKILVTFFLLQDMKFRKIINLQMLFVIYQWIPKAMFEIF